MKGRKAFGTSVSNLQAVRHKLADLKTQCVVARAFIDQCIELHARRALDNEMASMAKLWGSEVQNKVPATVSLDAPVAYSRAHCARAQRRAAPQVADEALQLHGGWGYMWEFPICRAYADARVQKIYGGANEIMRELIARSI